VERAFEIADAPIPPLENGDRLTRREFERRYNAMPDVKKAELIEGVVYMPSPTRANICLLRPTVMASCRAWCFPASA
jgi:hypothetical protein